MKRLLLYSCLILLGCQKELDPVPPPGPVEYLIRGGHQFAEHNPVVPFEKHLLKFTVRFDSSAIYTTALPENQLDINKLYGFSDNNMQHHEFSARFGWRWSSGRLSLHAYVYNNGIRETKEIDKIEIGKEYRCSIQAKTGEYVFKLNGTHVVMPRAATTVKAKGYQLYPYFGGDETAPHDIRIYIKDES